MEDNEFFDADDERSVEDVDRLPKFQLIGGGSQPSGTIASESPEAVAERISAILSRINSDYLLLGREIYMVFHRRLYLQWGYSTFDECMAAKFGISRERSERVRRVWSKYVKELRIAYDDLAGVGFSKAHMLLPIVNADNVRGLIEKARTAQTVKDFKQEIDLIRGRRKAVERAKVDAPQVNETKLEPADTADVTSPAASETGVVLEPAERPTKVTFNLYPDQLEIVQAAIQEVQRNKRSDIEMAPNEALSHVALGFMAERLTKDKRPNAQIRFYMHWLERIYGGKLIWVTNDEAAAVLSKAVEEHGELFPQQGKTQVVHEEDESYEREPDGPF